MRMRIPKAPPVQSAQNRAMKRLDVDLINAALLVKPLVDRMGEIALSILDL